MQDFERDKLKLGPAFELLVSSKPRSVVLFFITISSAVVRAVLLPVRRNRLAQGQAPEGKLKCLGVRNVNGDRLDATSEPVKWRRQKRSV
jgi:hypothetical protein